MSPHEVDQTVASAMHALYIWLEMAEILDLPLWVTFDTANMRFE